MKTNRYFAYMIMAAAVCACQKENVAAPEAEGEFFTACIEQPAPETKAMLEDGVKVAFQLNDKLRVTESTFSNKKDVKCTTGGSSGAMFSWNTGLAEAAGYYAVYKYQATVPAGSGFGAVCNLAKGAKKDGVQYEFEAQSNVFPIQIAVTGGFDPNVLGMVGKAGSDKVFRFSQMTSLLKFELKKDGVAKIVLAALPTADAAAEYIGGRYSMQCLDEDNDGWFDKLLAGMSADNQSSTITLLPPTGEATFPQGVYYIVTRPTRNCKGGISLTFHGSDDAVLKTVSNTEAVQLNRGKIRFLGSFTW